MNLETAQQSYRGVRCLSCRQPIPLPAILTHSAHEHPARVFSLRCRACEREKPYRTSEIMDFEGAPRTRVSGSRAPQPKSRHSESHSRIANS
jgi:hypothetical protein